MAHDRRRLTRERFLVTTAATVLGGASQRAGAQQGPALTTLRGTVVANDGLAPILYAQESGLFRKAGLDVQLQRSSSGAAIAAAVAGGSFDFGVASLMALISGHVHGLPFVLIAPSHLIRAGDGTQEMLVLKGSTIRRAGDLAGKVLAVAAVTDVNWIASRSFIDADGGDSATTKFVELPQPAIPAALEQKRIDAAILEQPALELALATGHFRSIGDPEAAIASRWLVTAAFTLADFAAKNRDVIGRFGAVMQAASAFANTHHAETAPLVAAFTGIDPAAALRMHRYPFAEYLNPREIQPVIDAAARYKVIDHGFPAQEMMSAYALSSRA